MTLQANVAAQGEFGAWVSGFGLLCPRRRIFRFAELSGRTRDGSCYRIAQRRTGSKTPDRIWMLGCKQVAALRSRPSVQANRRMRRAGFVSHCATPSRRSTKVWGAAMRLAPARYGTPSPVVGCVMSRTIGGQRWCVRACTLSLLSKRKQIVGDWPQFNCYSVNEPNSERKDKWWSKLSPVCSVYKNK